MSREDTPTQHGTPTPPRSFVLRLSVEEPLYQKLARAHEKLRAQHGSRAKLSDVLDRALDALLAEPPRDVAPVPDEEDAPDTVQAPVTMRWHPAVASRQVLKKLTQKDDT